MIQKLSHTTIWVLDQDKALEFYRDKLGLQVTNDTRMGDFRWLTVSPPGQPELELVLMKLRPSPMLDEDSVSKLKELLDRGVLGAGVFRCDDIQTEYEDLKKKGVEFISPPAERPYGIEALLRDNQGNWFSLMQPKR